MLDKYIKSLLKLMYRFTPDTVVIVKRMMEIKHETCENNHIAKLISKFLFIICNEAVNTLKLTFPTPIYQPHQNVHQCPGLYSVTYLSHMLQKNRSVLRIKSRKFGRCLRQSHCLGEAKIKVEPDGKIIDL